MPQAKTQSADPYAEFGGSIVTHGASDPYAEFGGKAIAQPAIDQSGTMVHMTDPSGNLALVPPSQAGAKLQQGYKIGPPNQQGPLGGGDEPSFGRVALDTLKQTPSALWHGFKGMAFYEPDKGETPANSGPEIKMAQASIMAGKQAGRYGSQAITAAKNKDYSGAAAMGGKALVTGAAALDPFAAGSVANVNALQEQGKTRQAAAEGLRDAGLLAAGSETGRGAVASGVRPIVDFGGRIASDVGAARVINRLNTPDAELARAVTPKNAAPETLIANHRAAVRAIPRIQQAANNLGLPINTADDAIQATRQAKAELLLEHQDALQPGQTLADIGPAQQSHLNADMQALDDVQSNIQNQQALEAEQAAKRAAKGAEKTKFQHAIALAKRAAGNKRGVPDISTSVRGLTSTPLASIDETVQRVFSAPDTAGMTAQRAMEGAQATPTGEPFPRQAVTSDLSVTPGNKVITPPSEVGGDLGEIQQRGRGRTPIWQDKGIQPRAGGPSSLQEMFQGGSGESTAAGDAAAQQQSEIENFVANNPNASAGATKAFLLNSIDRYGIIPDLGSMGDVETGIGENNPLARPNIKPLGELAAWDHMRREIELLNEQDWNEEAQHRAQEWIARHNVQPEPYDKTRVLKTRPPQPEQGDLSDVLQASIDKANAERAAKGVPPVSGAAPAAAAEPLPIENLLRGERRSSPTRSIPPDHPDQLYIDSLRRDLARTTDPAEQAKIQEAIDFYAARLAGKNPANAPMEDLPPHMTDEERDAQRTVDPSKVWPPKPSGGSPLVNTETLNKGPLPTGVVSFPVDEIGVDPKTFQFRTDVNPVTGEKPGHSPEGVEFDQELAGPVRLWRDPQTGKVWLADGHHRMALAKAARQENIEARFIDVPTAGAALARAALANIAEGTASPFDAARFFRDMKAQGIDPQQMLKERNVSLSGPVAKKAIALSNLDDALFEQVRNGKLGGGDPAKAEVRGSIIGSVTDDPAIQHDIAEQIASREKRGRDLSDGTVIELAKLAKLAGTTTQSTMDLFGVQEQTSGLLGEVADAINQVKRDLGQTKTAFSAVSKEGRAKTLSGVEGQTIKPTENAARSQEAAQMLEVFDKVNMSPGPVHDLLLKAGRDMASRGVKAAAAVREAASQAIMEELKKMIPGAGNPPPAGTGGVNAGK